MYRRWETAASFDPKQFCNDPNNFGTKGRKGGGAHLPIDGSIWVPAVARASCPWVCGKLSEMGKMPMLFASPQICRCAQVVSSLGFFVIVSDFEIRISDFNSYLGHCVPSLANA